MKHVLCLVYIISAFLVTSCQDDRLKLPQVQSSPAQLFLTSTSPTAEINLSASSPVGIRWAITYKPDWIQIIRITGMAGDGPITVTALTATLLPQTLTDKIIIKTATGEIVIPVSLTVLSTTAVQITPTALYVDYNENSKQFTITNSSNQSATWKLEPSEAYLGVSPSSGTLSPGQSSTLTLSINRSNLESKRYSESLTLQVAGVISSQTPVAINNFRDDNWLLDGTVTDAEYDRTGDNLIVIIDNKLYKLKPETRTISSVVLPFPGTCVSVGKNGQYAVVGHASSISMVDLTAMKVDKTYSTSADAMDVLLAPSNWAYVFPKGSGWNNVRCINLTDGTEVLHTGRQIYAGAKAKLHPSGDYIYTADDGLIPSDAQKLDIRNGQANFLYDSPYHGDHEFSGNLWIADDGSRMFTRGGDVYNLSNDQADDMIYHKTLPSPIHTLDHSTIRNRVCAVYFNFNYQAPASEVTVFYRDGLNVLQTKPLPGFLVGQPGQYEIVPSEGVYGFFNAAGTKFFVCVRSRISSVQEIKWAVATINID